MISLLMAILVASPAPHNSLAGEWHAEGRFPGERLRGRCTITEIDVEFELHCTFGDHVVAGSGEFDPARRVLTIARTKPGLREQVTLTLDGDGELAGWAHGYGSLDRHVWMNLQRVDDELKQRPVRFRASAALEGFFFSGIEDFRSSEDITFDLSERTAALEYDVDPIWLLSLSLDTQLRLSETWLPIDLSLTYKTSRVFGSAGTIDTGASGPLAALGIGGGLASDVLAGFLSYAGIYSQVTVSRFAPGVVRVTGEDPGEAPMQLTRFSGVVGYTYDMDDADIFLAGLQLDLHDYAAPRILYEFEDTNPDPEVTSYRLVSQSDVQEVWTRTYGIEGSLRWNIGEDPIDGGFSVPIGARFGIGAGPVRFTAGAPISARAISLRGGLLAGLRYRFVDPAGRTRFAVGAEYDWRAYGYTIAARSSGSLRSFRFSTDDSFSMLRGWVAVGI